MKAALNGVPSLSILDGWWIEGCIEGFTGWAIEDGADDAAEADSLYQKLETAVVPLYRDAPEKWARLMRTTLAFNGSYFNTNRMVKQYTRNAYYPVKLIEEGQVSADSLIFSATSGSCPWDTESPSPLSLLINEADWDSWYPMSENPDMGHPHFIDESRVEPPALFGTTKVVP
jgi:glucan phosphorylase